MALAAVLHPLRGGAMTPMKGTGALLLAALALGSGCDTTFGTLLLIDGAVTATTVATEAGPPADDHPAIEEIGGD